MNEWKKEENLNNGVVFYKYTGKNSYYTDGYKCRERGYGEMSSNPYSVFSNGYKLFNSDKGIMEIL